MTPNDEAVYTIELKEAAPMVKAVSGQEILPK
jgi:hypothetical protein